ncbi:Proteasome lid subunit RPN8/RPN11, contains Jab1/MPN metalloenzyme (JAMM) motif [Halobiforma haloterrestris]|uniref:Proteasome lid subunit RPN8/RPN11, contains Jab1/MPN metalloenzyme (JAMM) motif n=1 Tax=Natronobacterium haloterrestre TaxID=148448 RepID=A0A1I1J5W1_NATHA|nr:desampylase [Halobiforma haloterrestris]SFC43856.1 Proteasome lid subunit RPN8/RPN11, contains Jab1/MPN metalloenzyme (JAMM) motif [Halobiforma haloterrestris]
MIELLRSAYDEIVYQAYDGDEREVCGILAGEYDPDHTVVTDAYPAENVADNPEIRYAIDPEEQFEITERIEEEGLEVAGFYHSHPAGPAEPSETDAARATWPDFSYVIVALDGYPFVGSWRWRDEEERFDGERVRVVSSRSDGDDSR